MNPVILVGLVVTLVTCIPVILQLRSHPRGLTVLFFAEMWERFSYFGMRGVLIFYLTQHMLFSDGEALSQYSSYTSMAYLLPLVGGIVADRWLGKRKAVAFGALLLVAGHLTMGFEGRPAAQTLTYQGREYQVAVEGRMEARKAHLIVDGAPYAFAAAPGGGLAIEGLPAGASLPAVLPHDGYTITTDVDPIGRTAFYIAASLIIMGVAFLKPNVGTLAGDLYPRGDPRRTAGFTLYYYGVNLGAFWAAVLCGYLGVKVGWWAAFGLAGVGMVVGYVIFISGRRWLQGAGEPPPDAGLERKVLGPLTRERTIYLAGLLGVIPVFWLLQHNLVVGWALGVATVASLAFIAWFLAVRCDRVQRERMLLALLLIVGCVVFFTLFEQAGTSLNLFTARNVNLGAVTTTQVHSFNAGFILIFAPAFAALWAGLGARGLDPGPVMKFGLGLLQVGLGFLVVVWAQGLADDQYRMPLFIVVVLYLLLTTGELCLSPVGIAEITNLSVRSILSFMMAVWFLGSAIAQFVGGHIAALMGAETLGGEVLDRQAAFEVSLDGFHKLGWAGVAAAAVFFVLGLLVRGWSHDKRPADAPAEPGPETASAPARGTP